MGIGFDARAVVAERGEVAPDADGVPPLARWTALDIARQALDQGGEIGPGVGAIQVDPLPMVAVFVGSEREPKAGILAGFQGRQGLVERGQSRAIFGGVELALARRAVDVERHLARLLLAVGERLPDQPAPGAALGFR
ncbi:MAG: hypothetical protein MZV65_40510 [Chromatiales bacterium]|nr:hypothetical protein [Chromatiales bacterium]